MRQIHNNKTHDYRRPRPLSFLGMTRKENVEPSEVLESPAAELDKVQIDIEKASYGYKVITII